VVKDTRIKAATKNCLINFEERDVVAKRITFFKGMEKH